MNKIKLYHFSDYNIKNKISVKFYGLNSYTANDLKATNIKRAFYYIDNIPLEYRFKNSKYCYVIEVDKNNLYDLRIDKNNYINKYKNIPEILKAIKRDYIGIIYNSGIDIVNLFYDIKINKRLTLTKS